MPGTANDAVIEAARRAGLELAPERAAAALPLIRELEKADRALIALDLTEAP